MESDELAEDNKSVLIDVEGEAAQNLESEVGGKRTTFFIIQV